MVMVVCDPPRHKAVSKRGHADMSDQGIDPLALREGPVAAIVPKRKQAHKDLAVENPHDDQSRQAPQEAYTTPDVDERENPETNCGHRENAA
jgi:hypothetical protein